MPESALVIVVPEAEPLVSDWRAQYDWSAQRGVPAHITLLYPFAPTEKVDDELLSRLRKLFVAEPAISFELARVARFPEVAWLAPEPSEPFKALTDLISARFPDYPPYEGAPRRGHSPPDGRRGRNRAPGSSRGGALRAPADPCTRDDVAFLFEDDEGLWHEAHRFPFAG